MYIRTHIYTCMHACMDLCIHIYTYILLNIHMNIYIHIYIRIYTYICMCITRCAPMYRCHLGAQGSLCGPSCVLHCDCRTSTGPEDICSADSQHTRIIDALLYIVHRPFGIGSGATHGLGDATLPSGALYRFLLSICILILGSFISICDSYVHLHVGFICVTHSTIRTTEYRLGALA